MESYKHLFAKRVLAEWFTANIPVIEWPVGRGALPGRAGLYGTARNDWTRGGLPLAPTYEDLCEAGVTPLCIFDLAIFSTRCGSLIRAVEVVHSHDITPAKLDRFERIAKEAYDENGVTPHLYRVGADWVLQQTGKPTRYDMERVA